MKKTLFLLMLASAAIAQLPLGEFTPGSVSGVVRNEISGEPMSGVRVSIYQPSGRPLQSFTDSDGRYTLNDVPAGDYVVAAEDRNGSGVSAEARVSVQPGQALGSIDLRIAALGTIAGRVVDENGEPVSAMGVLLVERNYVLGELHYNMGGTVLTDDRGRYRIARVVPGRAYLLLAKKRNRALDWLSRAPEDPNLRLPALASTYYPNAPDAQTAVPITLNPGEVREDLEIRVPRTTSYCIDGVIEHPSARFWLEERYPYMVPRPFQLGGMTAFGNIRQPEGNPGSSGRFRVCGLHPDEYQLVAYGSFEGTPPAAAILSLTISDADIHDLRLTPALGQPLMGEAVWDIPPADPPGDATVGIFLRALNRRTIGIGENRTLSTEASVPGPFQLDHVLPGDYSVSVPGVPDGAYIKDITYAGLSILHKPLKIGSAMGDAPLRIILGHGPGYIAVEVADDDGSPVLQATVIIVPESVVTEAEFAAALTSGITDQTGRYQSGPMAPGEYLVMTTNSRVDYSPETIGRLWRARIDAEEVDLAAGQTVSVRLSD